MELESVDSMTVSSHEDLLMEAKQPHAEEISVWKEPSTENAE